MKTTVECGEYKSIPVGEKAWLKRALHTLEGYAPQIRECAKCGNPVADGYGCLFCGNDDSDE